MRVAPEGAREIIIATVLLGAGAAVGLWFFWPLAVPFAALWLWVIWFFRDPPRRRSFQPNELCAPADGTITEIADLEWHELIGGPALRIGMFLGLFDVHANRASCSGTVRRVWHEKGEFLDARLPESGRRNESNTMVVDPEPPIPGPVVIRQVAGLVARRIVCSVGEGDRLPIGHRFGMIKFGSRTELIIPRATNTEVTVEVGDKVKAGLDVVARLRNDPDSSLAGDEAAFAESGSEHAVPKNCP